MARPAIIAIARWEWSRRWRALIALGILGGVTGGAIAAGAMLTRRTITAPERLIEATAPGDVHLRVFGDLADQLVTLPGVAEHWTGGVGVGRLEGSPSLAYVGVIAPIEPSALVRPVIVSGRAPSSDAADEIMLTEAMATRADRRVGDHLQLAMLSAEEVSEFDTGFGEPDGPRLDLTITGIVRVPPGMFDGTPVIASAAFAGKHADLFAGVDLFVSLRGGAAAAPGFTAAANALAAADAEQNGVGDFAPVTTDSPRAATDALIRSSHVLFAGLLAALGVAIVAALGALVQAWSRHHGAGSAKQQIESALGLPTGSRVAARLLPAAVSAAGAGAIAAVIGACGSWLQPVGSVRGVEPARGWRFDGTVVGIGSLLTALAVVSVAAMTAWRAGRIPVEAVGSPRGVHRRLLPRRHGWPLAGATFALGSGPVSGAGRRHVPVRVALVSGVIGVAGVVGSSTFAASLDRLTATPSRYGWNADFDVADVNDEVVDQLVADARLSGISEVTSASVDVEGHDAAGFEFAARRGDAGFVLWHGRLPTNADEVVLGAKLAANIDAGVGDGVVIGSQQLQVVGIGLEPTSNGEVLGSSVLFGPGGLREVGAVGTFREALVQIAPGIDRDAVIADYSRYELSLRTLPEEVRNVAELGSLPAVLGAFLALLAAVALAHALVVTIRQRARDVAVMRALGATPRQAGLTVISMAVATAAVGLLFGVPLGYALARLVWGELAESIAVRGDVTMSISAVVELVALLAAAVAISVMPARRASRIDPGQVLRSG